MFILSNTQIRVEIFQVEGFTQPFYNKTGDLLMLVREVDHPQTFRSVNPNSIITVAEEPPMFKADIDGASFEYPDFAVWCHHCHLFMGWASRLNLAAHCNECRSTSYFPQVVADDVDLYVQVQRYHYANTHGPSDDDYHDGMYNAHQQVMDRLDDRWHKEGALAVMGRLADQYDVPAREVARYFNTQAEPAPERELVGALARD
jgi:hypothetical protein